MSTPPPAVTPESPTVSSSTTALMSPDRLKAFSDGVFGVAITLLILTLQIPRLKDTPGSMLLKELLKQWPSWASYLLSFMLVGIGWINHHQLLRLVTHVDITLLALNMLILMCATIIPYPTALLAEYIQDADGQRIAAVFYGGVLTITSLAYLIVWLYAGYAHLLDEGVTREAIRRGTRGRLIGILLYVVATLIALINAPISVGIYALSAVYYLITVHHRNRADLSSPNPIAKK